MKHREVVANFIFKWSNPDQLDQQVALFRRSFHPNIRSYQGKYAPISGSIESEDANPISAAEREILEETQLSPGKDLILEFCGKSYSFEDQQAGRSWTVHPFGWILKAPDNKIKIDWEHDSWTWFDPQKVFDSSISDQCVPKLDNSLQRVYFGSNGMFRGKEHIIGRSNSVGRTFLETINRLKTDTENGARILAFEALKGLCSIAEYLRDSSTRGSSSAECWHVLILTAYHFIYSARPSMRAAISTTLLSALDEVQRASQNSEVVDARVICDILERCINQRQSSNKIAESFKSYIDQIITTAASVSEVELELNNAKSEVNDIALNIITLSYSSTILKALSHLFTTTTHDQINNFNLTILESRPLFEGASLASALIESLTIASPASSTTQSKKPKINIKVVPESHTASTILSATATASSHSKTGACQPPALVLLGADRITPYSNVINKTGSCALAVLARILSTTANVTASSPSSPLPPAPAIRTIVLSESDKIASASPSELPRLQKFLKQQQPTPASEHHRGKEHPKEAKSSDMTEATHKDFIRSSHPHESHPAEEVYGSWPQKTQDHLRPYLVEAQQQQSYSALQTPKQTDDHDNPRSDFEINVDIENVYFEGIPSEYIDVFIGEDGELSRDDIMRISVQRRELEDRIFADLYPS